MSTLSIATSGLTAASLRLDVAANNIANVLTTGPLPTTGGSGASRDGAGSPSNNSNLPAVYVPLQVNQADLTPRRLASNPGSGTAETPGLYWGFRVQGGRAPQSGSA